MSSSNLALPLFDSSPSSAEPTPTETPVDPLLATSEVERIETAEGGSKLPPMLQLYLEYKKTHSDCLIFMQVGDFYELFFEDALTVSEKLNLTLTSRDKSSEKPVPMCGVPIAAVDSYIERLVDLGFSVCLVSQMNSQYATRMPTFYKEGEAANKTQIQRAVSRIITPGVRLLGNSEREGVVAAVYVERQDLVSISWTSVQSGKVTVREGIALPDLTDELKRIGASEVILPRSCLGQHIDLRSSMARPLTEAFGKHAVKIRTLNDNSLSSELLFLSSSGQKATKLLKNYIEETTLGTKLEFANVILEDHENVLQISAATRDNLELVRNAHDGSERGTLLEALNETKSFAGKRLLRSWICFPLCNRQQIEDRQQAVMQLQKLDMNRVRQTLSTLSDIERHAARLDLNVIGPRELFDLRSTLEALPALQDSLASLEGAPLLATLRDALSFDHAITRILREQLADNPPAMLQEGGVIRDGFNTELDEIRLLRGDGNNWLTAFETQEKAATGIPSLKVKFNLVVGFFIEITRTHLSKVPTHYQRRQSTATCERYTTPELREREKLVLTAGEKEAQLERRLYQDLKGALQPYTASFRTIAAALATIDVLQSFAYVARRYEWTVPEISEVPLLQIEKGEHPVLSIMLQGQFIPNSLRLHPDQQQCIVLTGPNMGGKSTYLRQAGLLTVLAQIGSFVPAQKAVIGLCDKLFARIGASDNITEGESTFMVEMRETSQIVANATERSLLLIDEVGRGTATSDGLAIAQAILEWISEKIKCRTLFATHFHELTSLEGIVAGLKNSCVKVVEKNREIIFMHEIIEGAAGKSYGLEVAKLAGLPKQVLKRAALLLSQHEADAATKVKAADAPTELFAEEEEEEIGQPLSPIEISLQETDPDALTPKQALDLLYKLKEQFR